MDIKRIGKAYFKLFIILIVSLAFVLLINNSGNIYRAIYNKFFSPNIAIRESLENGGAITLRYSYIPAQRDWDTNTKHGYIRTPLIYSYSLSRQSSSGDCNLFICKANSGETVCNCYFSEDVWNEFLDLIFTDDLEDVTSVYDENGMVTSVPVPMTLSIFDKVYKAKRMDLIEARFIELAGIAGVDIYEITDTDNNHESQNTFTEISDVNFDENNNEYDLIDDSISDINALNEPRREGFRNTCIYDPNCKLEESDKETLRDLIMRIYDRSDCRIYAMISTSSDPNEMISTADELLLQWDMPGLVFVITPNGDQCMIRWIRIGSDSAIIEHYQDVYDAYFSKDDIFSGIRSAIIKAEEIEKLSEAGYNVSYIGNGS